MRVIVPKALSLLSSNVAEALHTEWLPANSYAAGEYVYVTKAADGVTEITPHRLYKALIPTTIGDYPADHPTQWFDSGATNQGGMFDSKKSTPTQNTDSIQVTVSAAKADRIALFNLVGESVQIVSRSGATVILDETVSLRIDDQSASWSEYFYDEIEYRTNMVRTIPGYYANLEIDITITAASGTSASCGYCIVGKSVFIGVTEYGVQGGITDFSRKERDDFGETFLNEGNYTEPLEIDLFINTPHGDQPVAKIKRILVAVRAVPCVWDANNHIEDGASGDFEGETLYTFGVLKKFTTVMKYAAYTHCSLEIQGLI